MLKQSSLVGTAQQFPGGHADLFHLAKPLEAGGGTTEAGFRPASTREGSPGGPGVPEV